MTRECPRVSVIIPTYKHSDYVVRTVESVFAQTFADYELIVVNDGSPDDTAAVLAPLVTSGKIHRYIEQANAGQGAARNNGIAVARGEFIALLDDDDTWEADKLEWQVAALRENPSAAAVYGFPSPVDGSDQPVVPRDAYGNTLDWPFISPGGHIYRDMVARCWLVSPGQALLRRSALPNPAFDPTIRYCDDWDLWIRLAESWEILFENRSALRYRLHDGNASRDSLTMRRNEFRLLHKHLLRNLFRSPRRFAMVSKQYLHYLRWTPSWITEQARADLAEGKFREAREKLEYAQSFRPYLPLRPWFRDLYSRTCEEKGVPIK